MAKEKVIKKPLSELPFNETAEQAVIGSALLSVDALFSVLSILNEDAFYETRHKLIFNAIVRLQNKQKPVDVLTVTEELINTKDLEAVGGVNYLKQCTDSMVALSSLSHYLHILQDQACLRNLLIAIHDIDNTYHTEGIENIDTFIQQSDDKIKAAIEKRHIDDFLTSKIVAEQVQMKINSARALKEGEVSGLTTGFPVIDTYTQGFQKGEITVVAARPSVGKTALALNFAYNAATKKRVPVAIFSLEMNAESLMKRLIASESLVSMTDISKGDLNANQRSSISEAVRKLQAAPIYIDESRNIKLIDIVTKSKKLQAREPELGLIIVDYLGLVTTSAASAKGDSRQEEVRKISLTLKSLAMELGVPIVVVSQLSRDVEKRDTKRPMLSDLRDSGSIEQDADVVMLLYREDYYKKQQNQDPDGIGNKKMKNLSNDERSRMNLKQQQQEIAESMPGDASYVEINVAKNRNGQTGRAYLFFYKSYGKFDLPPEDLADKIRALAEKATED